MAREAAGLGPRALKSVESSLTFTDGPASNNVCKTRTDTQQNVISTAVQSFNVKQLTLARDSWEEPFSEQMAQVSYSWNENQSQSGGWGVEY